MPRFLVVSMVIASLSSSSHAVCTLNPRLQKTPPAIVWNALAGVDSYLVQESFDNFETSRNFTVKESSFAIQHRSSKDVKIYYRITATLEPNALSIGPSLDGCTEELVIGLRGDAQFRAMTRKAVIPIVGSAPGAFGARFKTTLKLRSNAGLQRGRIIFHPLGAVATDSDPSMVYDLTLGVGQQIVVEDVVAKLGSSGVGSLDIVPDEGFSDLVPVIEARSYNDTGTGTFGFTTGAYYPFDFLEVPTMTLVMPAPQFRVNIGIRAFTAVQARALVFSKDGRLREFHDVEWPAGVTSLSSVKGLIGVDLLPGEGIELFFDGAGIPFYTVTENSTNDPELFVPGATRSTDVGAYVE